MLAALGRYYRWPRAELEGLSARGAAFWSAAANGLERKRREEEG